MNSEDENEDRLTNNFLPTETRNSCKLYLKNYAMQFYIDEQLAKSENNPG